MPDWKVVRDYLRREGTLSKAQVSRILQDSMTVMCKAFLNITLIAKEPNMVRVPEPVVVVGDVHGQYYDLLTLLEINHDP